MHDLLLLAGQAVGAILGLAIGWAVLRALGIQ